MDRAPLSVPLFCGRIPHTRGDGPMICRRSSRWSMYSPHAWGWTNRRIMPRKLPIVFPTRVGMDRDQYLSYDWRNSIPHTRGDGPSTLPRSMYARMYSPHAWGWTGAGRRREGGVHVFPTRVGMDHPVRIPEQAGSRIPHTRGDGPLDLLQVTAHLKYSPHAWGWTAETG